MKKKANMSNGLATDEQIAAWEEEHDDASMMGGGLSTLPTRLIAELRLTRAKLEAARKQLSYGKEFLKILIDGKSQYEFDGKLMANGIVHAKELLAEWSKHEKES